MADQAIRTVAGSLRRARVCAGLLVLAMLTSGWMQAADAARLERAVVRAGGTVLPNDPGDAEDLSFAVAIEPERPPRWLQVLGERVSIELVGGWLVDAGPPTDTVAVGRAGVVWHHRPAWLGQDRFVEFGPGLAVRDGRVINDEDHRRKLLASIQVSVGNHFGSQRRGRLALRWQHTSDAGTPAPSPGIDLLLLEIGYRFGR